MLSRVYVASFDAARVKRRCWSFLRARVCAWTNHLVWHGLEGPRTHMLHISYCAGCGDQQQACDERRGQDTQFLSRVMLGSTTSFLSPSTSFCCLSALLPAFFSTQLSTSSSLRSSALCGSPLIASHWAERHSGVCARRARVFVRVGWQRCRRR